MLQAVHRALLRLPEFVAIRRWIAASHIAGLSNVFADMASRPEKRHLMFTLAKSSVVMGTELTKADTSVEWLESAMEELPDLGRARGEVSKQGEEWLPTKPVPPGQHEEWHVQEETRKRKGGPEDWSPTQWPAPGTHPQSD